jgi:hypothetical protein
LQRVLTTATLVGLLIATTAAFTITERLKLEKSPITVGTRVSKVFSPTCGCARGKANIRIKLRRSDTISVTVLDAHKRPVRFLVAGEHAPRGLNRFRWDGLGDTGARAPDGTYYAEIHLDRAHTTIVLPNKIELDTAPPKVTNLTTNREDNVFSPDGDGQADYVRVHYQLTKPAHAILYLDGRRILGPTYRHPAKGELTWRGTAQGEPLPAGTYALQLGAVDLAGNSTPVAERWEFDVTIRFIQIANHHIAGVSGGKRFEIGISTDSASYRWKLGRRTGVASGPMLRLRAPQRAGRYTLTVTEHGHSDRAAVFVR